MAQPVFTNSATQLISGGSSVTFAFTTSGNNRLLIVFVNTGDSTNAAGVTYNGVAMTLIDTLVNGSATIQAYSLISPAIGSNNIVVTMNGGSNATVGALAFSDARQSPSPIGTVGKATNSGTATSQNFSTNIDDIVLQDLMQYTTGTITDDSGQTRRYTQVQSTWQSVASTKPGTGSTVTVGWSFPTSGGLTIGFPIRGIGTSNNNSDNFFATIADLL